MNISEISKSSSPRKIIQFGEGNFLRAFADRVFCAADSSGIYPNTITLIKPIRYGNIEDFTSQNCNYTVYESGIVDGAAVGLPHIINNIKDIVDPFADPQAYFNLAKDPDVRVVISNTTEAGITYDPDDKIDDGLAETFPGKAVQFLYKRFLHFNGEISKGIIFLPCELIDNNGDKLKQIILRFAERDNLGRGFIEWINEACIFAVTLVDRIVVGRPANPEIYYEKLGYTDWLIDICEPFFLWVIASSKNISDELPINRVGLDVVFTDDITPYRERKVRILNGIHTSVTPAALAMDYDFVHEAILDPIIKDYISKILHEEILISVRLPQSVLESYSASVLERFANPLINHRLASISLNSISKWRTRVLPSLKDYIAAKEQLPRGLVFSFAALLWFYLGKSKIEIQDTPEVTAYFMQLSNLLSGTPAYSFRSLAEEAASNQSFWGESLNDVDGFTGLVSDMLSKIEKYGIKTAMEEIWK